MTTPTIRFMRVSGIRSLQPAVLAFVNEHKVTWNPRGWDCDCSPGDEYECVHIEVVQHLLDPLVTSTTEQPRKD